MKYSLVFLLCAVVVFCAFAVMPSWPANHKAAGVGSADVKVLGTSNLHDWSMEDKDVACSVQFTYAAGKAIPEGLTAFTFTLPVHSLKSGKSGMDSKAYGAMKAKNGSSIAFAATSSTVVPGAGDHFTVKSDGSLTIAGVTKEVVLTAACSVKDNGTVTCTGSDILLMSDYQIKPPTYMLGALRTGNKLTIDYTMIVQK